MIIWAISECKLNKLQQRTRQSVTFYPNPSKKAPISLTTKQGVSYLVASYEVNNEN